MFGLQHPSTQTHSVTMAHLSIDDRIVISHLHCEGRTQKEIAKEVGCHPSTVCRELARNIKPRGRFRFAIYDAQFAEARSRSRRADHHLCSKLERGKLFDRVAKMLDQNWSPQQISGTLREEAGSPVISHQSIYTYLWTLDKKHPHRAGMRRHGKRPRKAKPGFLLRFAKHRVSIHDRPKCVAKRTRIGDWELDLMAFKGGSGFLITAVDRKSGVLLARKVPNKQNHRVIDGILNIFKGFDRRVLKTFTFDNGVEFYHTRRLKLELGVKVYHADPYNSGQRGTNENTNGLVRQYIPKPVHYGEVSHWAVKKIQRLLNDRPRLRHKYQTPTQFFENHSKIAFQI